MALSEVVEASTNGQSVANGRRQGSNQQYESLSVSALNWAAIRSELCLSRREAELVGYILRNLKLATIADEMNLSVGTVKTYLQRIHRKLGISGHVQLILKVMDAQLRLNRQSKAEAL
jgi:DNA-binding CsgD family transcriptional regulator